MSRQCHHCLEKETVFKNALNLPIIYNCCRVSMMSINHSFFVLSISSYWLIVCLVFFTTQEKETCFRIAGYHLLYFIGDQRPITTSLSVYKRVRWSPSKLRPYINGMTTYHWSPTVKQGRLSTAWPHTVDNPPLSTRLYPLSVPVKHHPFLRVDRSFAL